MRARARLEITLIFILMSDTGESLFVVAAVRCVDVDVSLRCGYAGEAYASIFIQCMRAL